MIITLSGADFSKSNIGILTKWRISTALDQGAVFDGPATVEKGAMLGASIVIAEGYVIDMSSIRVTMDGVEISNVCTIEDNKVNINITSVTGDVVIQAATKPLYTFTIAPTPETAFVSINGEERKSITVPAGTDVDWLVSAVDYKTQTGVYTVNSDTTLDVALAEADIFNLYNPEDYPVQMCYYGNSFGVSAATPTVINSGGNRVTKTVGMDVCEFPIEGGKTYTVKLYNAPTTAVADGDTNNDGTSDKGEVTIPYYYIHGFFFYETIDGKPSVRYAYSVANNPVQVAYWSTAKQSAYTGHLPISETNDTSVFNIAQGHNDDKIIITNLATGAKSSESTRSILGPTESMYTQACQIEIKDENITGMTILIGNPKNSMYQMQSQDGVLSDEDRAAAFETVENGLMIVEGTRLPAAYIAYQEQE